MHKIHIHLKFFIKKIIKHYKKIITFIIFKLNLHKKLIKFPNNYAQFICSHESNNIGLVTFENNVDVLLVGPLN